MTDTPEPTPVADDADEATVVSARHREDTEQPADVDAPDEATVVSSRRAPHAADDSDDADEKTRVSARRQAADAEDESTVVSPRKTAASVEEDDDKTAVVDKKSRALEKDAPRRRRGQLRPAPVPVEVLDRAVPAAGPGAVASYAAREIQAPPVLGTVDTGDAAVRQDPATIPSMGRRSERAALVVLASLVGAVVLAVVGLVAIAFAVFG